MMTRNAPEESRGARGTPEEIWAILRHTSDLMAESDARMVEVREGMKETDRLLKEQAREADRRFRETDRQMQETDRRLKKAEGLFTSQWGKLMESLVEGDLVPLLKERGIAVEGTLQRFEGRRNGQHFEIDILALNGTEVVVVEVKTTLRPRDVTRFVEKLSRFACRPGQKGEAACRSLSERYPGGL